MINDLYTLYVLGICTFGTVVFVIIVRESPHAMVVAGLQALSQGGVALPDEPGCHLGLTLACQNSLLVTVHSSVAYVWQKE